MKVEIELFGASRDFSEQNSLNFEVDNNSTIKDIRNKIIDYLDKKFNGNGPRCSLSSLFTYKVHPCLRA